jgi:hypothetical protein
VILEPPQVAVGEMARVEIAVVTPPDHQVEPVAPPEPLEGFWVIGVEVPTVERRADRWVHRMGVRIRARAVGSFEWPAGTVTVEDPEGGRSEIELAALPLEVVSVLPEFPERTTPFGLAPPPAPAGRGMPAALAAAAGAGLALAAVGAVALVRRRRAAGAGAARAAGATPAARPIPEWDEARAALARARSRDDPVAAAALASAALRRFAARRFGSDAPVRTTEELSAGRASGALGERLEGFLALLRHLDAARFRGRPVPPAELAAALDDAEAFVRDATPEALR